MAAFSTRCIASTAIRGGRIVYAGPRLGADALAGPSTRKPGFPGRTILPGLADAHGHLTEFIVRAPPDAILATRVVATYIGGKPVYERGADSTAH